MARAAPRVSPTGSRRVRFIRARPSRPVRRPDRGPWGESGEPPAGDDGGGAVRANSRARPAPLPGGRRNGPVRFRPCRRPPSGACSTVSVAPREAVPTVQGRSTTGGEVRRWPIPRPCGKPERQRLGDHDASYCTALDRLRRHRRRGGGRAGPGGRPAAADTVSAAYSCAAGGDTLQTTEKITITAPATAVQGEEIALSVTVEDGTPGTEEVPAGGVRGNSTSPSGAPAPGPPSPGA